MPEMNIKSLKNKTTIGISHMGCNFETEVLSDIDRKFGVVENDKF